MLARAGIGSRRACEELIEEGRVEVDGRTVRSRACGSISETAVIRVDGARLAAAPDLVHLAINKPRGS